MNPFQLLTQPYLLASDQIAYYEKNGFIKLKNVLSVQLLGSLNAIISNCVTKLQKEVKPLDERDTYGKAFLQLFNLWKHDEQIAQLVLSKRLGQIASQLMQVEGVRLYHDQALFKESGGGITPWHADQHYWPLQSDKTITAWIPLQQTPLEMGPLEFSAGSQQILAGRELSISDESETTMQKRLKVKNFAHVVEPFDAGEISFHSGWVFHRAGPNTSADVRKAMTIIYMDKMMRLKKPENNGQQNDWATWCPGAQIGEVINSPLNPVII